MEDSDLIGYWRAYELLINAELDAIRMHKHPPHIGMSCGQYEQLLAEARASFPTED